MTPKTVATLNVKNIEDATGFLVCEAFMLMVQQITGGYRVIVPGGILPSGDDDFVSASLPDVMARMAQEAALAMTPR